MRSLLFAVVLVLGCSDNASGTLSANVDSTQIAVGATTFMQAYLIDGMGSAGDPIAASWSAAPSGIITLTATNNVQKVTGVAAGNVVVTVNADGQTTKVGLTVTP